MTRSTSLACYLGRLHTYWAAEVIWSRNCRAYHRLGQEPAVDVAISPSSAVTLDVQICFPSA
jgi:hypothetical protein